MVTLPPSALITDDGNRVYLRLQGKTFRLSQDELRDVLGLPAGRIGLGICIERDRLSFEFDEGGKIVELTSRQLLRKLTRSKHQPRPKTDVAPD